MLLKSITKNRALTPLVRFYAYTKIQKKHVFLSRWKNYCILTGRAKGTTKTFNISRHMLNKLSQQGYVTGYTRNNYRQVDKINNIFKSNNYIVSRFAPNNDVTLLQLNTNNFMLLFYDYNTKHFYKIPVGFVNLNRGLHSAVHICVNTFYSTIHLHVHSDVRLSKQITDKKLLAYKPAYFDRFKYIGKGFKLILKKKR